MKIFPAIDLYEAKAVRLFKGDYKQMTVYNDDPVSVARDFEAAGAGFVHVVDLEGAKSGTTPNIETVRRIARETSLFVEIGGGIRNMETVEKYLSCGVDRVIIGTAAITDETFLREAVSKYGEKIAVGADVRDGNIAIKGWLETSAISLDEFMCKMQEIGVCTVICTDISKDGAMKGTNLELYKRLCEKFSRQEALNSENPALGCEINIIASGGVSDINNVKALANIGVYGAIIGKAYYTGDLDLREAVTVGLSANRIDKRELFDS